MFGFLKSRSKGITTSFTYNPWDERRQIPLTEPTDRIEISRDYGKIKGISWRVLVDGKPHNHAAMFYDDKRLVFVFMDKITPNHEVILEYQNHPNGIEDLK